MVLKNVGNILLVRPRASQWNPDKCASMRIHAFILLGADLAETAAN